MKRLLLIPLLAILTHLSALAQNQADRIVGIWMNEDQTTKVEIFKAGNSYSGKIIWLAKPNNSEGKPFLDKNNPDRAKRGQKILGLTIITGLKYTNNQWSNGTIYAPRRGMYADCSVALSNNGNLEITVTKSGFSRTKTWTKE